MPIFGKASAKTSDVNTFAQFAGTVITRLPRDLGPELMATWSQNPHTLKEVLAKALSEYSDPDIERQRFAVVLGRYESLTYLAKQAGFKLSPETDKSLKYLPGCERKPSLRPALLEIVTLLKKLSREEFEGRLALANLRYSNVEELLSLAVDYPTEQDKGDIIAPGTLGFMDRYGWCSYTARTEHPRTSLSDEGGMTPLSRALWLTNRDQGAFEKGARVLVSPL